MWPPSGSVLDFPGSSAHLSVQIPAGHSADEQYQRLIRHALDSILRYGTSTFLSFLFPNKDVTEGAKLSSHPACILFGACGVILNDMILTSKAVCGAAPGCGEDTVGGRSPGAGERDGRKGRPGSCACSRLGHAAGCGAKRPAAVQSVCA